MNLKIENLPLMSASEEALFWEKFEIELAHDDGAAARSHLEAGRPITYRSQEHGDALLRQWPTGRIEVIKADLDGMVTVERVIVDSSDKP